MRMKSVRLVVTALLALGLCALPASADKVKDKDPVPGGLKDTGLFSGGVRVGKLRDGCTHDGTSWVHGSGLGRRFDATKNAYWEIGTQHSASATSLAAPLKNGVLRACGRMTQMFSAVNGGLGAACDASKGWDGKGTLSYPGTTKETIWLKELGWKFSTTMFVMTGTANQDATEAESKSKVPEDVFVAAAQLSGVAVCETKQADKPKDSPQGGQHFVINGTYTIVNGEYVDPNALPLTCKSGLDQGCLYEPKQTGASG